LCEPIEDMEPIRRILARDPTILLWPLGTFMVTVAVGLIVRKLFFRVLRAWTDRTQSRPALILTDALKGPTIIWILIAAVHLAIQVADPPGKTPLYEPKYLSVLWILSLTVMGVRLAGNVVRYYGDQVPGALPVTTLTRTLAELSVALLGIVGLLSALDFRITPILTALGVGGLAVALALQDTLSNLFSGFYVAVARQVRLGDYIKLNTGEEGYVTDIGWRSTTIRALQNNVVLIPNAKLAQAVVTNYFLPEKRMSSNVQVVVGHSADPDGVEAILLDVVESAVKEVPGMAAEPAPNVMFDPGYVESGLGFTVNYQVAEFVAQFGARNEMRKRIYRRLREEGIEFPYPPKTVYLRDETRGGGSASLEVKRS
jgi:small-conductance mechanosensitive channel